MTWAKEVERMLAGLTDKEREVLAERFGLPRTPATNQELLDGVRKRIDEDPLWSAVRKSGSATYEARLTMTKPGLTPQERLMRAILGEDRPAHERDPVEFDDEDE